MNRRARILVPGDPSAVAFARDRVITQVRAWRVPLDEEKRHAVKLVASELITNAVKHAGGFITVGLYFNEDRLLMVVHDKEPAKPKRQQPVADDEAGRGLALVDSLATRNGWEPTANGKRVWAEFEVLVPVPARRAEVLRWRMNRDPSQLRAPHAAVIRPSRRTVSRHAVPADPIRLSVWRLIAILGLVGAGAPAAIISGASDACSTPSPASAHDLAFEAVTGRHGPAVPLPVRAEKSAVTRYRAPGSSDTVVTVVLVLVVGALLTVLFYAAT